MGSVYRVVGPETQSYIGSTFKNPAERWAKHVENSGWRHGALYDAIRTHGAEAFTLEILHEEIADKTALRKTEGACIRQFDSVRNGWNRIIAGRTRQEWAQDNRAVIAAYNRRQRERARANQQPPAEPAPEAAEEVPRAEP